MLGGKWRRHGDDCLRMGINIRVCRDTIDSSVVLRSAEMVYSPQKGRMAIPRRKKSISPIKHLPIDVWSSAQRAVESVMRSREHALRAPRRSLTIGKISTSLHRQRCLSNPANNHCTARNNYLQDFKDFDPKEEKTKCPSKPPASSPPTSTPSTPPAAPQHTPSASSER